MKKTSYKTVLFISILFFTIILSSCGVWRLDSKIKQLELGMTKKEVVALLGNRYDSIGAIATPDGNLETVKYIGSEFDRNYIVRFLDGELVEWFIDESQSSSRPLPPPLPN